MGERADGRWLPALLLLGLAGAGWIRADPPKPESPKSEPPLVEKFLHRGELARGELALLQALEAKPTDDQARFGLGFLRAVRAVERLGQALHEYGVSPGNSVPFLRVPVPKNPDPAPVTYLAVRRFLGAFQRDLDEAERTLAPIVDDRVKLDLRVAAIRLDLTGDGVADDDFKAIIQKLLSGMRMTAFDADPELRVCFDRGDVAWLRAYCHLLSGMVDVVLALDLEEWFDAHAAELFAKPKARPAKARARPMISVNKQVRVVEPARLGQFRKKLLAVAELNRETWRFIRAEVDNDHEWLPNPKQRSVLLMEVNDQRIDDWLSMMNELQPALEGKRTFPRVFAAVRDDGKELNFRALFDDPPEKISVAMVIFRNLPDK